MSTALLLLSLLLAPEVLQSRCLHCSLPGTLPSHAALCSPSPPSTPPRLAAYNNHADTVTELIRFRPNVDAVRSSDHSTPIFVAAAKGYSQVVSALLSHEHKANVNIPNAKGETPLLAAVKGGHIEVVRVLLAGGNAAKTDVNACSRGSSFLCIPLSSGMSCLEVAVSRGKEDLVQLLLGAGAAVTAGCIVGAVKSGKVALLKSLFAICEKSSQGTPHGWERAAVTAARHYPDPTVSEAMAKVLQEKGGEE